MHAHNLPVDQAAGLRRLSSPPPVQVISVTSGKGGVGKTNISINLAAEMSERGRSVMLLDADLGLANVDVVLGLNARYNLSHVLSGERSLEDILIKGPGDILIVPAASGIQYMAELSSLEHGGLIQAFSELRHPVDTLIIDTAAGISDSVVCFSQASTDVVVVVCDEPASLTDAYALIKVLSQDYGISRFHILTNIVQSTAHGMTLFNKLLKVTERFLDVTLDYFGSVPDDPYLRKAVQRQRSVVTAYPRSCAALEFKKLAGLTDNWPIPSEPRGHMEFFLERLLSTQTTQTGRVS